MGALRSTLTLTLAIGLAGCGTGEPRTDAERLARGRELVQKMSDRLAAQPAIRVTTNETRDFVGVAGKKEAASLKGEYALRRPNRFHARMQGTRDLEAWYGGKVLTIASHPDRVFAQAPMPEDINRTFDALTERYDLPLPMGDLFYTPATKALLSDTATGGYVGVENVGDTPCSHLAFKNVGADFDLWIPLEGEPLPKRFRVVQKSRTGQPVVDLIFNDWNLAPQLDDATFDPKVPADYEGIAVVQRAAAVKKADPAPAVKETK